PPDEAVRYLCTERRLRPPLAGGRHHVDMPIEDEWRAAVRPWVPCDEIRATGRTLVALGLDAVRAQQALDERDARLLVSRRVRRVEADQIAQQLDRIDHSSSRAASR